MNFLKWYRLVGSFLRLLKNSKRAKSRRNRKNIIHCILLAISKVVVKNFIRFCCKHFSITTRITLFSRLLSGRRNKSYFHWHFTTIIKKFLSSIPIQIFLHIVQCCICVCAFQFTFRLTIIWPTQNKTLN